MTTTRDNATTWRELADDLTPSQRDSMEFVERQFAARPTARNATADLLDIARGHIEQNLIDITLAGVPLPSGATDVSGWEKNLQRDGWSRTLVWRTWDSGESAVDIAGRQESDGTYTRQITLEDGVDFTSTGARQVAGALIEAADEIDRLSSDS
jgi:hypothetical protein